MNLPTKLTVLRIVLLPVLLVFAYVSFPWHDIVAAAVFVIAAATDFLDGYLARKLDQVTSLGKFLDPIADKMLVVCALFIVVGRASFAYGVNVYVAVCAVMIMSRELMIDAFRLVAASKGIVIAADKLGKAKTLVTDIALPLLLLNVHRYVSLAGLILLGAATLLTIWSGINYVARNKRVLKDEKEAEAPSEGASPDGNGNTDAAE